MNAPTILFYAFEGLTAISAVAILFARNVFHAALLLLVCLLAIAGIFVVAMAEFIAVTQIMIYAGGVLVLILFGIMLTSRISGKPLRVQNQYTLPGIILGACILGLLTTLFTQTSFFSDHATDPVSGFTFINQIGIALMGDYVLPFEFTALLLLIALIGAAVVASSINPSQKT